MTADELRRVYDEERDYLARMTKEDTHLNGLLAVARYVAQAQRKVEPTPDMLQTGVCTMQDCQNHRINARSVSAAYLAMQRDAPLVTDTPGGSDDSV